VAEQAALSFGGLLRQLRAEARLTQEDLAEAAGLSPRSVSDLERGINRTARKDTAELLAGALGLVGPARESFVAAARGRGAAEDVLAVRAGQTPEPGRRVARGPRGCPYRGLLPFSESDAGVFYGRERLAAELAAKLAGRAADGGLVVVTGASGAGKSSLLRAGLLPILARGEQIPGSDRWPRIVMTPTKDPLTELAARLAALGGPDALAVRDGLARHPDQAHLAIRSAVLAAAARRDGEPPASGDAGARLVLIVDQFEQVFTLNPDLGGEATRRAFITALYSAAATLVGEGLERAALVVIAVRGDFWDRCAAVPELVGALQDGQFVVGPMTESELRVAVTGPAEAAGLRIDVALTETILGDLRVAGGDGSAGVLPLLSQAMALTWEQREGDRLTGHGYAQAGGVSHAVQTGADRAYETLPAGQQALAREVLRSMTVASRDGGYARRPVTREDLYAGLPGADRAEIDAVLDAFAAERLAVLDEDRAQLSHDVLLRAWPRLRGWLEEDQASWILHGQLADAAAAWHDSGDDPSFLYRGAQLAALRQAITRWSANPACSPVLTGTQRGFVRASERAAVRSGRRRRAAFAVLALLTALAVATSGVALYQRAASIRERDQVIYNQLIAQAFQLGTSDPTLAAQLTLAAYRIRPSQDLASRLLNTENTPLSSTIAAGAGNLNSMAFSPDNHTLATSSSPANGFGNSGSTVQLWDVADPAHSRPLGQPLTAGNAPAGSLAFSPGGHTLASLDGSGTVWLWNVTDPAHPRPLGQPLSTGNAFVDSLAFSPGGHTLVISSLPASPGSDDGTVRLWDVADPAHPRPLGRPLSTGNAFVHSLALSPDNRTLAVSSSLANGSGGTVRLWDVTDPAHPRPLGQPPSAGTVPVDSPAFSPRGHTLADIDADGTVGLWDVTDPAHPRPLGQPLTAGNAPAASIAFSLDGRTLASGGSDGTVRLWDITDPAHPRQFGQLLAGSTDAITLVAFSSSGHTLASEGLDGVIRLWSLPQTVLTGGPTPVASMAFNPDGHTLANGSGDGTVRLWDVTDPAHPRPLGQPLAGNAEISVAFSPDGHTLVNIGAGGTVRLWDVTDPAHPRPLGQPPTAGSAAVDSVVVSPGGHTLAIGSDDGTIRLWDIADPAHPRPLGQPLSAGSGYVGPLAFTPGGHTLAISSYGGTVELWDVADPAHPRLLGQPLTAGSAAVDSVVFSPGGHTLAIGSDDGTVRLWDVADPAHPRPLSQPLTAGNAYVGPLAFTPGGHTLVGVVGGSTVRLWDIADRAHPRPLGGPPTGGASAVDSVAFSPDGYTLATGSLDGTTRLWNLNVQYAIQRICATVGGLTPQQWNQYIPQLQYQSSCAD
jgi:WD40 repeat protein/transcriptional regulator with XRE-family HTH domain